MIPSVHLNGTSRQELIKVHMAALLLLNGTIRGLQGCCPNGRDFYVQSSDAINTAIAEHRQRLTKLDEVKKDLETILEKLTE